MATPASAPSIESLASQDQIAVLVARIEKLEAIIELYISPIEEIFSDDADVRAAARRAVSKKVNREQDNLSLIPEIQEDFQEVNAKLDALLRKRKPGEVLQKRLQKTNEILLKRNNEPVTFTEMRRLLELPQESKRQSMTKLGHVYQQYPDKYEVRDSKFGGKTIKLNPSYFKHLTKEGV